MGHFETKWHIHNPSMNLLNSAFGNRPAVSPIEPQSPFFTNPPQSINFPTLPPFGRRKIRPAFGDYEVAHSLSAKKRIRQSIKRRARNRARKEALKDQTKAYFAALATNDIARATDELRKTVIKLDKVAAKNTIHKNTASRRRSRLTRRLNALKAGGKQAAAGA